MSTPLISNVLGSYVQRDPADGITGGIGEIPASGAPDGLLLNLGLNSLTYGGAPVGAGNPSTSNRGELRIRALPEVHVVPTGVGTDYVPWKALGWGAVFVGGLSLALAEGRRRMRLEAELEGVA